MTSRASGSSSATASREKFSVKPPEPVKFAKSVNDWKIWKQLWHHYCITSSLNVRTGLPVVSLERERSGAKHVENTFCKSFWRVCL